MKALIWDMFELRNTGGPSGYLFNLHEYIKCHPNPSVFFLSDIINNNSVIKVGTSNNTCDTDNITICNKRNNAIRKFWHHILKLLIFLPNVKSFVTKTLDYSVRIYKIRWNGICANLDLSEYDFIHFHFVIHIRQFRNTYPQFKGKIILTSHCPCPWSYELIDSDKSLKYLKPILIRQECKTYRSADYLLFPCIQAREPYEHNKYIKSTLNKLSNRTIYVTSAILTDNNTSSRAVKRSDFNIPESAFIIGFFGRHNHIKGFDILKSILCASLNNHPNLYVLCAGSGDIAPLIHPRWKELGFVSNVHEIMKVCDMYVLPNRETYFDLVVIEALRAGMILSISRTGGNKYFEILPKEKTRGLFFFDINSPEIVQDQISLMIKKKEENSSEFKELKNGNYSLFCQYFSMEKYIENYICSLTQLQTAKH